MSAPTKNKGGAPKGNKNAAKLPEERVVVAKVCFANRAQHNKFKYLGGSAGWLQPALDRAQVPRKKPGKAQN